MKTVAVLGASNKPDRYSNMAVRLLKEKGHAVVPIHPKLERIEGFSVAKSLRDVQKKIDTLSVYVGPKNIGPSIDDIIDLRPDHVILNPGTEAKDLEERLSQHGISFRKACTLVLLRTGQF